MKEILANCPHYAERILPYIGGEEVNSSVHPEVRRYVIFLSDIEEEADLANWPYLREIVLAKVKPERDKLGRAMRLRRDSWVSVMYAEELNSTKSSDSLQRTDRHGILVRQVALKRK
jgi:hypothetical protein